MDDYFTLQNILLPELSPDTEFDLFFRSDQPVAYSASRREVTLPDGGTLKLDTYFNSLSLGKWHHSGALRGLWLRLDGTGAAQVKVSIRSGETDHVIFCDLVELAGLGAEPLDLSHYGQFSSGGVLWVEIMAMQRGVTIRNGSFLTAKKPENLPRLALSITTFRREDAVRATVERLSDFLASSPFRENIHIFVVDNGQSAGIENSNYVTSFLNPNFGGAGGFARGLIEAEQRGFTHCLFMDDDASCLTESVYRTYAFLTLSDDLNVAVAGAMVTNTRRWMMWENGAVFDGSCHPQFIGMDLRNFDNIKTIEEQSASPAFRHDHRLYGGWWFFAFPITKVRRHPFPFFVRGDDISFSLANDFNIYTLNGVVSFQDDFAAKESPQTLYLDLRNHLVHHLVFPELQRSGFGTAKIALRFIMRSIVKFKYETAGAQLLAWQDVMRGPQFFDENLDMSAKRGQIAASIETEKWRPIEPPDRSRKIRLTNRSPRWHRLFVWLLNGHLIPFWNRIGDDVVLELHQRGLVYPLLGARRITYLDQSGERGYVVRQSKRRFLGMLPDIIGTTWRFLRNFDKIRDSYRKAYPEMASKAAWERRLSLRDRGD